jgi:hypothetical protein
MNNLYRLLGARLGGGAEGVRQGGFTAAPSSDDILHTFDQTLRQVGAFNPDWRRDARAEGTVAREVESAIASLRRSPTARLTHSQTLGLETVVRADGTRPSLLISEGAADPKHPMAARWRDQLAASRTSVETLAAATARVQPRHGSSANFFGSAFLIRRQPARLVTNRHVAMQALRRAVATREPAPHALLTSYLVHAGTIEVEFVGEQGNPASNIHAVQRVILPPWPNMEQLPSMDIAVLELATPEPHRLPEPIKVRASDRFEAVGVLNSFCTIGFPAAPAQRAGIVDGVDWGFVDRAIFNERYGVKRLAPGIVQRSFSELDEHGAGYTFGHDATTLGGSSGSAICAWIDGGAVFGLHFSGVGVESNRAHGISSARTTELLRALLVLPSP